MLISLASRLLQNPQTSPAHIADQFACAPPILLFLVVVRGLKSSTILLIDVSVALLLHAVLQDHGDAKHKDEVDANDAKCCGKYTIEVLVGERREWANASALLRSNQSVCASSVRHKWWCSSIDIAAAIELLVY